MTGGIGIAGEDAYLNKSGGPTNSPKLTDRLRGILKLPGQPLQPDPGSNPEPGTKARFISNEHQTRAVQGLSPFRDAERKRDGLRRIKAQDFSLDPIPWYPEGEQPVDSKGKVVKKTTKNTVGDLKQTGRFTKGQAEFVAALADGTGLNKRVIAAWVLQEMNGAPAQSREAEGNHNWLNIAYFNSGAGSVTKDPIWGSPKSAAAATVQFLKGQRFGASSGIQQIIKAAGKDAGAQFSAIGRSGWAQTDSGGPGYGGLDAPTLRGIYNDLSGVAAGSGQAQGGGLPRRQAGLDPHAYGDPAPSNGSSPLNKRLFAVRKHAAEKIASQFGLHLTSDYRTPAHNAEVNGVPGSLHTKGLAFDMVGPNMEAAAQWAQKYQGPGKVFDEVLVHDAGSGLHLHLGFNTGSSATDVTIPAGSGAGDYLASSGGAAASDTGSSASTDTSSSDYQTTSPGPSIASALESGDTNVLIDAIRRRRQR
jgi:hypothetical protein